MPGYDFIEPRKVICAVFEPNLILHNFTFGELFMWIGAINDNI